MPSHELSLRTSACDDAVFCALVPEISAAFFGDARERSQVAAHWVLLGTSNLSILLRTRRATY